MKNIIGLYLALILLSFCMISHAGNIAYIHGDVSEAGFTPSSSATTGATTPYDQMLLTDTGNLGVSTFASDVRAQGHSIDQYYDQATVLNDVFLSDKDVIVFGLHQKQWSSIEQAALDAWLNDGGGMLIYSDSASGGFHRIVGAQNDVGQQASNSLIAPYGIEIMVDQANGAPTIEALETASVAGLRGLELMGEGVSPIAYDPNDSNIEVLFPYTGPIRTNQGISFDNPAYAALALRQVGEGNIIALFDRQPIWNNGNGANIRDADNRTIFINIINFLASRDAESEPVISQDDFDLLLVPAIIASFITNDTPTENLRPAEELNTALVNGVDYEYFRSIGRLRSTSDLVGNPYEVGVLTSGPSIEPAERDLDNVDDYGFIFKAYIEVPENGTYTFYTTSDDGSDLFIGDEKIVDNDGSHGAQERFGEIALEAGLHPITLRYFQGRFGSAFEYAWQGPGFIKQNIGANSWFINEVTPVDPDPDRPGANNTGPTNENVLIDSDSIRVRRGWAGGGSGTEEDPYIVENVNVSGSIRVEVPHVIVRNFRASADALYVVQTNYDGVYNVLIEDGEVIGGRTNTSAPIIVRDGVTLRRLEIHESGGDGVKVQGSNFTMENCWVYDLGAKEDSHADGVQGTVNSGRWSNHVYRNNFFDMAVDELVEPYQSNITIFLHAGVNADPDSGIDNVIIENNWLIGGNFSLTLEDDMTDVVVRNNQFGRIGHEVRFGNIRISTDDKIVTGNTIEDTGELVPEQ